MNTITNIKVITLLVLWVGTFIFSYLPWILEKWIHNSVVLFSVLNCLSGGVVLGAALSHLLPDAISSFEKVLPNDNYPYASLSAACSLLILYTIEIILLSKVPHSHTEVKIEEFTKKKDYQATIESPPEKTHTHKAPSPGGAEVEIPQTEDNVILGYNTEEITNKTKTTQACIFMVALSIHSIFEGLGLGAESDEKGLLSVLIAVVSHKLLEAFALGLSIFYAKFRPLQYFSLLLFYSLSTPIGTAIGIGVGEISNAGELVSGILVSLAAGSFLYISLIEILPQELHKPEKTRLKIGAMFFGWAFMALIAKWA